MRSATIAGLMCAGLWTAASPIPEQVGTADPLPRPVFVQYTNNLTYYIEIIRERYVREVSAVDLSEAALHGLYEAVRQPVPAELRRDLVEAETAGALSRVILNYRRRLGDDPALAGGWDLRLSLRSLTRVLDPYCGIDNLRGVAPDTNAAGESHGLGIELADVKPVAHRGFNAIANEQTPVGLGVIRHVWPGSPAQQAGLRPGDQFIDLSTPTGQKIPMAKWGEWLGPDTSERELIPPGFLQESTAQPFRATLVRPGHDGLIYGTLARSTYKVETVTGVRRQTDNRWDFLIDAAAGIGFLRIGPIGASTDADVSEALERLSREGLKGLVLDLRGCPGGYLDPAVKVASLFLAPDTIIYTSYRRGEDELTVRSASHFSRPTYTDFPLVVLINRSTIGGGELLAAALQDNRRAAVIGERTFGKASIQRQVTDRNQLVNFRLSESTFRGPNGRNLQRHGDSTPADDWGVRPDVGRELPLSVEAQRQLSQWWQWQMLRPAGVAAPTPLDDPDADPQLAAALALLREAAK